MAATTSGTHSAAASDSVAGESGRECARPSEPQDELEQQLAKTSTLFLQLVEHVEASLKARAHRDALNRKVSQALAVRFPLEPPAAPSSSRPFMEAAESLEGQSPPTPPTLAASPDNADTRQPWTDAEEGKGAAPQTLC